VHDIINLEDRGVPAAYVASTEFAEAGISQAGALGCEPAAVFVAHPIQDRSDAEMKAMAESALADILAAVTAGPLKREK
jgi:hypothetical protein